jgi:spermidine synthase
VWGFVLASPDATPTVHPELRESLSSQLRFLTPQTLAAMFELPADMRAVPTEVNRLNNQVLVRYYDEEWSHWN